jgi:5-methylcytosine-specific restriction endonuclease McrA
LKKVVLFVEQYFLYLKIENLHLNIVLKIALEKQTEKGAKKSGTWSGGDISYYGPNWLKQRRLARKRKELSVHHIIPFRSFNGDWERANELPNLICLCEYPCHRKRHSHMTDN